MASQGTGSRYILPSLFSQPVTIDPSADGTIFRRAVAIEAIFHMVVAVPMILAPESQLDIMCSAPFSPQATLLMQIFGALNFGTHASLFLTYPNTRRGLLARPTVYAVMACSEAIMLPVFAYAAWRANEIGLAKPFLINGSAKIALTLFWRWLVLFVKPEWMGKYLDNGK